MKDASQYPITEPFGWQKDYPLHLSPTDPAVPAAYKITYPGTGYGFHTGIDWGCPVGTPIIVNGVTIGLSGATGMVFGAHVHVGRYLNGVATDPGNPWDFQNAVVSEIGEDSTNGKYVRVQADGASYVYLHMSNNTKVSKGQELKGGTMAIITTEAVVALCVAMTGRQPQTDEEKQYINQEATQANLDGLITYWAGKSRVPELEAAVADRDKQIQALTDKQGVTRDGVLRYVQDNLK